MSLNWKALFRPESLVALGKTTIPENALTMIAMLEFLNANSRILTEHPRAQILTLFTNGRSSKYSKSTIKIK